MPLDQRGFEIETKLLEPWQKTLLTAADLIRRRGLAKFTQLDPRTGSMCLHGALSIAETGLPDQEGPQHCRASREVAALLIERGKGGEGLARQLARSDHTLVVGCAAWNNAHSRTAAEVIEILETAALRDRAQP